jgi:hypothetical protein
MAQLLRTRIPLVVAASYASAVVFLLLVATFTTDEFGYRFIPVLTATFPLSLMIYGSTNIFLSVFAGGAVNTLLLFALMEWILSLASPKAAKWVKPSLFRALNLATIHARTARHLGLHLCP